MVRVAMVVTNACAPDPRVLRHAAWMVEAGYEVTVHAFDREERHALSENHNGVRVMRYRIGTTPYGGTVQTYRGIRKFHRRVIQTLLHDPPALVYCHDADTLRVGIALHSKRTIPFVFDMHDLQHMWVRYPAPKSRARSLVSRRMKHRMLQRAQHAALIITSSAAVTSEGSGGFVEWLALHGLPAAVVENRPLPPFTDPKLPSEDGWTVGCIGRLRDLKAAEHLLAAVRHLEPHQRPRLRIAGDGVAQQEVHRLVLDAVEAGELEAELSGAFAADELGDLLADIDVMYAMYAPERGNIMEGALPVRMFDAAAQGIPSVVNGGCLMADIVATEQLGASAQWNDVEATALALLECKDTVVELTATGEREHRRWLEAMRPVLDALQ